MTQNSTILVADDDASIRVVLQQALSRAGFEVRTTSNAATLWKWVSDGDGDLVITDVVMPDENGLDLVPRILKIRPNLRIVVMSAQSTIMTALKATERGAFEYLPKPFDINVLVDVVKRGLEASKRTEGGQKSSHNREEEMPLIGRSSAMQDIYRIIARLTQTDLSVIVNGESGTGKELVAKALHDFGRRRHKPFVAINMAAIPKDLIESELFGHEKGAFTGATHRSMGRFEQAQGGTLFLDEIGDMPAEAQTRLLRVLQEGEYTTVGGRTQIKTDVRVIAATHRDLKQLIRQGRFREDLFFRLNVAQIRIPPLRERTQDIPELVQHFLNVAADEGLPWKTVTPSAMDRLKTYAWPGNVRELENMIKRLVALCAEDDIDTPAIEAELAEAPSCTVDDQDGGLAQSMERHLKAYFDAHGDTLPASGLYDRVVREVERPLIQLTLDATRGNQLRAADILGLNRNTLRKKIRDLDILIVRVGRDQ